jgi:hypothetical protein
MRTLFYTAGLFIILLLPLRGNAQASGKVDIIQDDRVDLLISKHIQINENLKTTSGYRIQIFFDSGNNSKTKAQSVFERFKGRFPSVGAYLTFKAPNYKVRVGDFTSKLKAQRFLMEVLPDYPNAYLVSDQINIQQVEP